MLAQAVLYRKKNDALFLEVFEDRVVDHLRFILGAHPCQELSFGFGYSQFVEGVLDGIRDILPGTFRSFGRFYIVKDIVQVQPRNIRTPGRHRTAEEMFQRLQTEIQHPLRLTLHAGNILDHFPAQALFGLKKVVFFVMKTVLILTNVFQNLRVFAHGFTNNVKVGR